MTRIEVRPTEKELEDFHKKFGSKNKKVFSMKTCPYGFKRPFCEEVCVDYKKCPKEEFRGKYP